MEHVPGRGDADADADADAEATVYERVGGQPFFDRLVEEFYARVAADAVLRPMYPDDLTESRRHLAGFLAQYWGGPPRYSEERGHPRLRMRHAPFPIGPAARDAWLAAMVAALDRVAPEAAGGAGLDPDVRAAMLDYFDRSATWMINQDEGPGVRRAAGLRFVAPPEDA